MATIITIGIDRRLQSASPWLASKLNNQREEKQP
jgi:hypothetical protein